MCISRDTVLLDQLWYSERVRFLLSAPDISSFFSPITPFLVASITQRSYLKRTLRGDRVFWHIQICFAHEFCSDTQIYISTGSLEFKTSQRQM